MNKPSEMKMYVYTSFSFPYFFLLILLPTRCAIAVLLLYKLARSALIGCILILDTIAIGSPLKTLF